MQRNPLAGRSSLVAHVDEGGIHFHADVPSAIRGLDVQFPHANRRGCGDDDVFARHRASVWLRSPRIVRIASRPTHTQPAQMLSRWKSPLNHATEEATMKAGTAKPVRKE